MEMQALYYLLSLPSFNLAVAFLAGFFTKLADNKNRPLFGIVYGFLLFLNISFSSFSSMFVGVIIAQILAGKIDTLAHKLALFSLFGVLFSQVDIFQSLFFLLFAFADEIFEAKYSSLRPFLPTSSLLFSIYVSDPTYFLALLLFDIAYAIAGKLFPVSDLA